MLISLPRRQCDPFTMAGYGVGFAVAEDSPRNVETSSTSCSPRQGHRYAARIRSALTG
jgi:hypothetical protein